jgi:hypothetical protein
MHTTKVVKTEQFTDECIAVTIRCCDNPNTDSVLTIAQAHAHTGEQIESMVETHHDKVRTRCVGMQAALQTLKSLTNLTKEHTDPQEQNDGVDSQIEATN